MLVVLGCILAFSVLLAWLAWQNEQDYRGLAVVPRQGSHPAVTAVLVGAIAAVIRGAVPSDLASLYVLVLATMLVLGWAGAQRAAGVLGVLAIPVLGTIAQAMLRPACGCPHHAAMPAEATLGLFSAVLTTVSLAWIVVDVLKPRPA